MKRALSIILALTLAFALLPTFAAAVDTETAELQSFTIDFNGAKTDGVTNYPTTDTNYGKRWYVECGDTLMRSNWQVLTTKAESNIYNLADIITNEADKKKIVQYYANDSGNYLPIWVPAGTDISENNTLAIKIIVPASGTYTLSADVWGSSSGGYAEIFVDEKSFGKESLNSTDIKTAKQTISFDNSVTLTAGEKILKIKNSNYQNKTQFANGFFSFTFTSTETKVNNSVSFVQTTNVEGYDDISVKSVMRGDSVLLTAHKEEIEGYEFVGWKRGANDDESAWIDIFGDSYNVWTNTFLTAIYKPVGETATATVDFWNQNGAYMGTATDVDEYNAALAETPSLTGFGTFRGWFTDGNVKLAVATELPVGTTNAVAQYEDGAVPGVKRDGVEVDGANVYNKAITFEKKNASSTCWMRDDNIISYDDTYTYNVWGATNITEGTATNPEKPVAILEYNEGYKAYMFEYDDCGYTIAEAGIIFGSESATVDICTKKYTSQRKVSHNQFTVPAETRTAKGYIIWKNASGAYQIDYFTE